jgi:class 3 adenylate cyclase
VVAGVPRGVVFEIGSRVAALAQNGEVLVTRTVVDLVAGSGLQFTDRGESLRAPAIPFSCSRAAFVLSSIGSP